MKRCSFGMYSFLTHGHFVSLRNFFLVSNKATKTLTTQKSIIWSKLRSLQSFGLRRWCTMLAALMFSCGLGSFPFLLETNNAFRVVTQTYFKSDHTINFYSQILNLHFTRNLVILLSHSVCFLMSKLSQN